MLLRISNADSIKVPNAPGCYWIIRISMENAFEIERPLTISRVSGTDPYGILYIGLSINLRSRFSEMVAMFNMDTNNMSRTKRSGHPGPAEWHYSNANKLNHPIESMRYVFEELDSGEIEKRELVLLTNYRDQLGEYPPWNQPPKSYKKYLPIDNPNGMGQFSYDPSLLRYTPERLLSR